MLLLFIHTLPGFLPQGLFPFSPGLTAVVTVLFTDHCFSLQMLIF